MIEIKNEEIGYPEHILKLVRQRLGLEKDDTSRDDEINKMSHDEVFTSALEWEGICGYEYWLKDLVQNIYKVTLE